MSKHIDPETIVPHPFPPHKTFRNLTGQTFERLTAIRFAGPHQTSRYPMWLCKCVCGNHTLVVAANLTFGTVRSCGCLKFGNANSKTHGMSHSITYGSWDRMMDACHNPNHHHYANYGGRGITVCDRWKKFANFYADMGDRPSSKHTIDRIDNNGNYEPGNCRWATWRQQQTNKRNNVRITFSGETMTLMEWSERYNLLFDTLRGRLVRGWSVEDALTRPIAKNGPRTGKGMAKYAVAPAS